MKQSAIYRKIIFSLFFISLLPVYAAADGNAGTEDIFAYGAGARAIAMGRTFVGLADDVSTVYWNPAGLYNIDQKTLTIYYSQLFEGSMYGYLGYAHPTADYGSFGIGIMSLYTGDIQGYDSSSYQLSSFSSTRMKFLVSYANQLPWFPLSYGVSVKMNLSSIENYSATSFNFDLSLQYNIIKRSFRDRALGRGSDDTELQVGLVFRNLLNKTGERLNLEEDEENYELVLGVAFKKSINSIISTRVLADVSFYEERPALFSIGTEVTLYSNYYIRMGYALDSGFSFGAGIRLSDLEFDYALGFRDLGAAHNVSISWRFGRGRVDVLRDREAKIKKRIQKNVLVERDNQKKRYSVIMKNREKIYSSDIKKKNDLIRERDKRIAERDKRIVEIDRQRKEQLKKAEKRINALKQRNNERLAAYRRRLEKTIRDNSKQIQALKKKRDEDVRRLKDDMKKQAAALKNDFDKRMGTIADRYKKRLAGISMTNRIARERLTKRYETEKRILKVQESDKAKEYMKGLEFYNRSNFKQALVHFRRVVALDPGYGDARNYINRILAQNRDISSYGKRILRYYRQGVAHYLAGRYQRAIAIWQEILKIDPYNKLAHKNIEMARKRVQFLKKYNR